MTQEKPKPQEVLRLIRNSKTGEQAVQIAGRFFRSLDEISHPKAKGIVLEAVGNLIEFAGGYEALVDAGVAPPLAPPPAVEPIIMPQTEEEIEEIEETEETAPLETAQDESATDIDTSQAPAKAAETNTTEAAALPPTTATSLQDAISKPAQTPESVFLNTIRHEIVPEVEEESSSLRSFWGNLRVGRPKSKVDEPLPVLNIGQQINLIVQKKLREEPQLQGRYIFISNDEFGGIEINVDGQKHDDVSQVNDPLVRMLIKLAIQEWEDGRNG